MKKDIQPYYIGLTGITTPGEATHIATLSSSEDFKAPSHQVMTGILVSGRVFEHQHPATDRYVRPEALMELTTILRDSTLPMIHYRTKSPRTLADQLVKLFDQDNIYNDDLCRAVQINKAWPPLGQLERVKQQMPDLRIAICLTPGIVNPDNRTDAVQQLKEYQPFMDYVVIDPSGGKGRAINPQLAASFYRAIAHHMPEVPITLTGGLNDENAAHMLADLEDALGTRAFGIDAESGLRQVNPNRRRTTIMSPEKAETYLQTAANFFKPTLS